jgi:DNA-binding transcriptional LysR family regulator
MQIELIETFLDLCETRSFNRTAERLGVTQSTVSGRIRALERALGCRLFTRSRAGTQITTAGMGFEPHARSLRRGWAEALHAVRDTERVTLRLAIQHDLAAEDMGGWVRDLQAALQQASFYVETDYSAQICADLVAGEMDVGVLFTPRPHPDLHAETVGEVVYRMVSTTAARLCEVDPASYVRGNFSPVFARSHAALLPVLSGAAIASGQSAIIAAILGNMGGTGYVLAGTAARLESAGAAAPVADAPDIPQTVYAAVHLRHRHRGLHRRLLRLFRGRFAGPDRRPGRG